MSIHPGSHLAPRYDSATKGPLLARGRGEAQVEEVFATSREFAAALRSYWAWFVYFDSFDDILPRTVDFEALKLAVSGSNPKTGSYPKSVISFPPAAAVARSSDRWLQ